jgi:hypothetical protein
MANLSGIMKPLRRNETGSSLYGERFAQRQSILCCLGKTEATLNRSTDRLQITVDGRVLDSHICEFRSDFA